jgi:hypothetical protein
VLAEGIRKAYDDLFRINVNANELEQAKVKNKFRTLTQGQKSDTVLDAMAKTFVSLCALADWTPAPLPVKQELSEAIKESRQPAESKPEPPEPLSKTEGLVLGQLCYNIQIILPATRDAAVYDALFRSLKEHLFR